jgi:hypothetical protein
MTMATKTQTSKNAPRLARKRHDLVEAVRILKEHQDSKAFAQITFHINAGRITRAEINRQKKIDDRT